MSGLTLSEIHRLGCAGLVLSYPETLRTLRGFLLFVLVSHSWLLSLLHDASMGLLNSSVLLLCISNTFYLTYSFQETNITYKRTSQSDGQMQQRYRSPIQETHQGCSHVVSCSHRQTGHILSTRKIGRISGPVGVQAHPS